MTPTPDTLRKTPFLLNPFQSIAGVKALTIGLLVIAVTSLIAMLADCRLDGILDTHIGIKPAAPAVYFIEGFGNWLSIALIITLSARIVAKSRYRALDVFGTAALARAPFLFIVLTTLIPGNARYARHLSSKFISTVEAVTVQPSDLAVFAGSTFITAIFIIYSVLLTYRAFATSCNAKGAKAVWYFAGAVLIGEVLSKILSSVAGSAFR